MLMDLKTEKGTMSYRMQAFLEAGKSKGMDCPWNLQEGLWSMRTLPCQHLDSSSVKVFSDFQMYNITLCCVKPLNLW